MKGIGLLKLFVLSLFTLGIGYFGLLKSSYVSAVGAYQMIGLNSSASAVNGNYNLSFLKGGGLMTQYLGVGKSVIALDEQLLFWWSANGLPYTYLKSDIGTAQGYFDRYFLCDSLSGSVLTGCNYGGAISLSGDNSFLTSVFQNFFSKVYASDWAYYDYNKYRYVGATWNYSYNYITVCFSSEEIGKTMCFAGGQCSYLPYCTVGGQEIGGLMGSREYNDLKFGNLPYSEIGYAPGQAGYQGGGNIDGGSQEVVPNTTTGDVMTTTCSKSTALQWYRANGYKSRMCYSSYGNGTDLYTLSGDAQAYELTGVSIEDVRFNSAWYRRNGLTGASMNYSEWFSYWRKTYDAYKKNTNHTSPFLGVPVAVFTLMGNVDSYGLPYTDASILEFCDLALYTSNYSASYSGIAQNTVCSLSAIDIAEITLMNSQNPDDGLPGYGNSSFSNSNGTIGSSRQGITNRPGMNNVPGYNGTGTAEMSGVSAFTDGTTFQNNFFNLLKSKFRYVDSAGHDSPIIPTYIVIFLCGLVIFRFMSH